MARGTIDPSEGGEASVRGARAGVGAPPPVKERYRKRMMTLTTLIDTATLASHLDDPGLVVIDCRFALDDVTWGEQEFAVRHIPRAAYVHLDRDLSGPKSGTNGRHPLPDPGRVGGNVRTAWRRRRRPGRRLRSGFRNLREPTLVAAALAGTRCGGSS